MIGCTCCKDCTKRKVGCHNTETCKEWAEYCKAKEAFKKYEDENRAYRSLVLTNIDDHERRYRVWRDRKRRGSKRKC